MQFDKISVSFERIKNQLIQAKKKIEEIIENILEKK